MVHMPLVERIGLDDSIPIGLWAVCGIVSHVLAPETLDVTQVLWCLAILTVVSNGSIASPIPIVPSIAIAIAIATPVTIVAVVAIMVVTIPTMMLVSSTVNIAIPTI